MEPIYDKKKFGERLRSSLEQRSISQSAAARWLGVDQTAVSAWCRGASDIALSKAVALSRWLGTSLDWLVGLSDDPGEGFSTKDRAAVQVVRLLEREGAEEVWRRLSSEPPPDASAWDGGATPNPGELKHFLNLMQRLEKITPPQTGDFDEQRISELEQRLQAAEKKLETRGRPRNTVGEKKRKAQ